MKDYRIKDISLAKSLSVRIRRSNKTAFMYEKNKTQKVIIGKTRLDKVNNQVPNIF